MKMLKRAQVGNLQQFILGIVTVAIVLAIGLIVLNELSNASTSDGTSTGTATAATNSTRTIITRLSGIPTWIGIIIIVSLAFIVLSYFIGNRQ